MSDPKRMYCVDCGRIEECTASGALPFPDKPIPWGWSWAIGGARCERCLVAPRPTAAQAKESE